MSMIPKDINGVAQIISKRDSISFEAALELCEETRNDMEAAFYSGSLDLAETILAGNLGLELDYLDCFIC